MASIPATRVKKGMLIKQGQDLLRVLEFMHVTPGNLRGFVRVRFRNIRSGALSDQKLRSEDNVDRAVLDEREMQYLYREGENFCFMDTTSYEQVHINSEALGDSVNYLKAEMLIKVLGAERRHRAGRTQDGVAVALGVLGRMGIPAREITMVNGSGLYQGNLVAPLHLVKLLRNVYRNPAMRAEYVSHLSIAGIDGTLAGRFRDLRAPRVVRAKTGTLDDVVALSGYVLGETPERALAFSILANGVSGHRTEARTLGDAIVHALVDQLYPPPPTPTPAAAP